MRHLRALLERLERRLSHDGRTRAERRAGAARYAATAASLRAELASEHEAQMRSLREDRARRGVAEALRQDAIALRGDARALEADWRAVARDLDAVFPVPRDVYEDWSSPEDSVYDDPRYGEERP